MARREDEMKFSRWIALLGFSAISLVAIMPLSGGMAKAAPTVAVIDDGPLMSQAQPDMLPAACNCPLGVGGYGLGKCGGLVTIQRYRQHESLTYQYSYGAAFMASNGIAYGGGVTAMFATGYAFRHASGTFLVNVVGSLYGPGYAACGAVELYSYENVVTKAVHYEVGLSAMASGASPWVLTGSPGYCFPKPVPGTVPLLAYHNPEKDSYFYSTDWQEMGEGKDGFTYQNTPCYVAPTGKGAASFDIGVQGLY